MTQFKLRIALAQLNLTVGDISGNIDKHLTAANKARDEWQADIIVFPELSLTGYSPQDMLHRPAFIDAAKQGLDKLAEQIHGIYCVVGHPKANATGLHNACSLLYNGSILATYAKQCLPNYSVFDEYRYFTPGDTACVVDIKGIAVGLVICEDLWREHPVKNAAKAGARIILSPNASPFEADKQERRHQVLAERAKSNDVPIVYVNCVNGQDELIFDGGSMVIDSKGTICQHAGHFEENLCYVDIDFSPTCPTITSTTYAMPTTDKRIYDGLVFGVREYIEKNKFPGAIVGLSGGIDSALTLCIAADAIGHDKITAYFMPSRYTAVESGKDAAQLASNLKIPLETINIEPLVDSFHKSLSSHLVSQQEDKTPENIQARCRGNLLMALSNNSGRLVLTTSNRSEMAVGYATLYGDMAGGLAVLKDIPKTLVYRLCEFRNRISADIPLNIIQREPTAELAFNQKDQDSLPPYPILDTILELYINNEKSAAEIIQAGFDPQITHRIIHLVNIHEYKRQQAPIGIRIHQKAFGRDRRYPITANYQQT